MAATSIENAIKEKLTGEKQKNTLDFITSMQDNGFSFIGWLNEDGSVGGWDPTYNGKGFGCVLVTDKFMFFIGLDWDCKHSETTDEELKKFAWTHVTICPQQPCKPPYCENNKNQWTIFGKEYESTCHSPLQFIDPDAKTLDNIKKLLLATK